MQNFRRAALAVLVAGALSGPMASVTPGSVMTASAADRTVFAGCVTERTDKSITLDTSSGALITIDTTWLKPTMNDTLTADCLTVTTMMVEGRYIAESVEAGDEPNEVHGVANNRSPDRENRADDDEREKKDHDD
jgi:hypothetical protein